MVGGIRMLVSQIVVGSIMAAQLGDHVRWGEQRVFLCAADFHMHLRFGVHLVVGSADVFDPKLDILTGDTIGRPGKVSMWQCAFSSFP